MAGAKTPESYTLLSGGMLHFDRLPAKVGDFLQRVVKAAHDPNVGDAELLALVLSAENPTLEGGALTGHGMVTEASFSSPAFQIMLDLLCRKRAQGNQLRVAERSYTMTIQEAATARGVHESAIRQAVQGQRLPAVKRGKAWLLDPRDVAALELNRRKAPNATEAQLPAVPALEAHIGSDVAGSFRLKAPGFVRQAGGSGKVLGFVPSFDTAAVIFGPKGRYRMFVLEHAADEHGEVRFDPFYVRGAFRVVEKINNAQVASERWRAFEATDEVGDQS